MTHKTATIHVRVQRGRLVVQGQGQTPRGTRFIRQSATLKATSMADPDFKSELKAAVEEITS